MAFRLGADDGPTLNAGLVALRISGDPRNSIFCNFSGGGGGGLVASGSAHGTGQCIYLLRYTENYDHIVRIGFCMTHCVLSVACTNF